MLPIAALLTAPRAARRLLLTACLLAPAALPLTACGGGAEEAAALPLAAVLPGSWDVVGPADAQGATVTFRAGGSPNFGVSRVRPGQPIDVTGDFALRGPSRIVVAARRADSHGFIEHFDVTVVSRDSITLQPVGGGDPMTLARSTPLPAGGQAGAATTPTAP